MRSIFCWRSAWRFSAPARPGRAGAYTLTGMGTGVAGTSKCATYQITIDRHRRRQGGEGPFKQQGRPERAFTATLDDKGAFKTKADVGDGNMMDVSGTISDKEGRILLDGYCKFEGKLTRKYVSYPKETTTVTKTTIVAGIFATALFAGAASAQQAAVYTWTGPGVNVAAPASAPATR